MAEPLTDWSGDHSKNKTAYSEAARDKMAWSADHTKSKTDYSEASKEESGWSQGGDGTYSFRTPILLNDPTILVDEGECQVNGPLRITVFSPGKEATNWS